MISSLIEATPWKHGFFEEVVLQANRLNDDKKDLFLVSFNCTDSWLFSLFFGWV
jgi:hypothetical protein